MSTTVDMIVNVQLVLNVQMKEYYSPSEQYELRVL